MFMYWFQMCNKERSEKEEGVGCGDKQRMQAREKILTFLTFPG
jgi:hypothetical protein